MLCFTPATAKALGRYVFQKIFLAHQEREKLSVSPITVTSRIPAAYACGLYICFISDNSLYIPPVTPGSAKIFACQTDPALNLGPW